MYSPKYWRKEKERLDQMTKQLLEYNPRIRIPIIITYWPQTDYLENAVQEVGLYFQFFTYMFYICIYIYIKTNFIIDYYNRFQIYLVYMIIYSLLTIIL